MTVGACVTPYPPSTAPPLYVQVSCFLPYTLPHLALIYTCSICYCVCVCVCRSRTHPKLLLLCIGAVELLNMGSSSYTGHNGTCSKQLPDGAQVGFVQRPCAAAELR